MFNPSYKRNVLNRVWQKCTQKIAPKSNRSLTWVEYIPRILNKARIFKCRMFGIYRLEIVLTI